MTCYLIVTPGSVTAMKQYHVAITIRSFGLATHDMQDLLQLGDLTYINTTNRRLTEHDLGQILGDIDVVIAGTEPFSKKVLDQAPKLKIISRVGVGLDSIDLETARKRGITVLSTPGAPVTAVAEHTVALILGSLKMIPHLDDCVKHGLTVTGSGHLLDGKNIGFVGMGRIGQKTARLLDCFGCRISYYDPAVTAGNGRDWIRQDSLEELVADCDVLTLHAPAQRDNRPILDRRIFSLCRKGIVVINTARGSLIDEQALVEALDNGSVAGAALDVQSIEPYQGPLARYPQVILTPHVASNTIESRQQMEKEAVANIIRTLEGIA